jgi:hypothetical protein
VFGQAHKFRKNVINWCLNDEINDFQFQFNRKFTKVLNNEGKLEVKEGQIIMIKTIPLTSTKNE